MTSRGKALVGQLMALKTKPYVKVGVLQEQFEQEKRVPDGQPQPKKHVSLGLVAVANEFGTDTIPERSYIRSTHDENAKTKWAEYAAELRHQIVAMGMKTDRALGLMGQLIKTSIQAKIRSNIPPPNAPSTIAAKGGKDKTLINTGQLLNSINYEVHRDGEKAKDE
jgi:hypothetical protein